MYKVRYACRIVASMALTSLLFGCAVERITPAPETGRSFDADGAPNLATLTVAVTRSADSQSQYELERFVRQLRNASVFRAVGFIDESPYPPDLIVLNYDDDFNGIALGWLDCRHGYPTVLSLGIIPAHCWEEHTLELTFSNPQGKSLEIQESYKHETISGWVALPFAPFEDWEYLAGAFEKYLRHQLYLRADKIVALANSGNEAPLRD